MNLPTQPPSAPIPQHHKAWIEDERRCDVTADIELSSANIAAMFEDYRNELDKHFNIEI